MRALFSCAVFVLCVGATVTGCSDSDGSGPTTAATPSSSVEFVLPLTPPDGKVGQLYNLRLSAKGGVQPYTFSDDGGLTATGLTTSPDGVVSGTPTLAGTFRVQFEVRSADGRSTAGHVTSVTIDP